MRKKFCERLKELRAEKEITQNKMAEELSLQRYNISDWEQGRTEPDLNTVVMLAKFFKVTTDYLLGYTDEY